MPQQIYDPHVHFIDLEQGNYHWLRTADNRFLRNIQRIKRSFSAADLMLSSSFELHGVTHIEAGFDNDNPEREMVFVNTQPSVQAAVSHIPLDSNPETFIQKLSLLMLFDNFIGIRDISEGEDFLRLKSDTALLNLSELDEHDLLYEAQFNVSDDNAVSLFDGFAKQFPRLKMVINHCGFPESDNVLDWEQGIIKLSKHPNIAVKFSGFEMLKKPESAEFKQQVLDVLLTTFSENRIMFASNFPLCLTQKSYQALWEEYANMQLTAEAWHKLSFANAARIYAI